MNAHHHIQIPTDLDALLLEEKQRVLREMIDTFTGHRQKNATGLARTLQTQLSDSSSEQTIEETAVLLRAELLKVLKSSSWFWNLKPSQDSAYQSLKDLATYWPLNNKDENQEAEDPITLNSMGCPFFLMSRSPEQASSELLLEMLNTNKGDPDNEAYVYVNNDLYYFCRNGLNARPQVTRLRVEPQDLNQLKAILAISSEASIRTENYAKLSNNLRLIQMLSITRMTGHETFNRMILSSGRQRQVDGFCSHLRNEPSDPETRETFGERDREYINHLARQRHLLLNGIEAGFTPPLRDNARSHANAPEPAPRSNSRWGWGEVATVLGLTIYCIGVVGLCMFTTGALALASWVVFLAGAVISLTGCALMGSQEAAVSEANRQNFNRILVDMLAMGARAAIVNGLNHRNEQRNHFGGQHFNPLGVHGLFRHAPPQPQPVVDPDLQSGPILRGLQVI